MTNNTKLKGIIKPKIPPKLVRLDNLQAALRHDDSLSGFSVSNQAIAKAKTKALTITESKLEKITASEANFEKLGLSDVLFERCDLTATNCAESSWRRVYFKNMRCSGLKLQTSMLKDVLFEDCKLDLSNFRFTKMKNVLFIDCVLDEADFYSAELDNVQFQSCSLFKTEFSAAKCKSVDLRTSEIADVLGIEGLKGATIDGVQLISLAPLLASQLGLKIKNT